MDDGGIGCLVLLAIIVAVLKVVTNVIKSIVKTALNILKVIAIIAILIVAAVAGAAMIWGVVRAIVIIWKSLCKAKEKYDEYGSFKSSFAESDKYIPYKEGLNYSQEIKCNYEKVARPTFFFGSSFTYLKCAASILFPMLWEERPDGNEKNVFEVFFVLCARLSYLVIGLILNVVLIIIMAVGITVSTAIMFPVMSVAAWLCRMSYKLKGIRAVCKYCRSFVEPVYICPKCKIQHTSFRPGRYGVWRRRCVCGAYLPLTVRKKAYYYESSELSHTKITLTLKSMECKCPVCNKGIYGNMTKPIGISLSGYKTAGKTTFNVAFLKDFIDDESIMLKLADPECAETNKLKYSECKDIYYGRSNLPGGTDEIETFEMVTRRKHMTGRKLTLYDVPGELFKNNNNRSWHFYEHNAGIVFMIDPSKLSSQKYGEDSIEDIAQSMMDIIHTVNIRKSINKKYTIPIAIVISKVDSMLLKKQVGIFAEQYMMNNYPDVFKDKDITMDFVCRCFLEKNGGANAITLFDNEFENVHYFYCSSIGRDVPNGITEKYAPDNVMPIMQWLITKVDKTGFGRIWKAKSYPADLKRNEREMYKRPELKEIYEGYYSKVTIRENN